MRKISFSNLSSGQIGQLFQGLDIHLEEANRADDEYEEVPYQAECGQGFENHWKGSILLCEVHRTIRILGIRKPLCTSAVSQIISVWWRTSSFWLTNHIM